ncbi:MAG: SDR family NAD(P)-dependent oxidoreductase [Acidimicrobiales bacterium]
MSTGDADPVRRVCIFAGASGRLGSYFCENFADRYDIVAVYRRNRPLVATHDAAVVDPVAPERELVANRRQVFAVRADLTDERECDRVVELALARFDRIDLLVNAAVSTTWGSMIASDHLRRSGQSQFATNVLVPLNLATAVVRQAWQGRDEENRLNNRNVVNVSSVAGLRIYTGQGQSIYAASKAALNQLTGHMAEEFAAVGVRVNATAPNSFPSIIPTSRAAEAIVRLDEGSDTGTIVVVDGDEDSVIQMRPFSGRR